MENWLESVYSDGSAEFVSNQTPRIGETVTVRLRMYEDAPVKYVYLRSVPNGGELKVPMHREKESHGLVYWACELPIIERRTQYHFYIVCADCIYFYTQKEITTYLPEHTYDFVLLTDYVQPTWVKDAVFYQIFP